MNRNMKALSIQQPWAWLIAHGYKNIENRCWPTNFRGKFLIHTGKKIDKKGLEWVKETCSVFEIPCEFEIGGIVGIAEIVDCVEEYDDFWFFGPYGFVIENAKPVKFVPMKGRLGFFTVPVVLESVSQEPWIARQEIK